MLCLGMVLKTGLKHLNPKKVLKDSPMLREEGM